MSMEIDMGMSFKIDILGFGCKMHPGVGKCKKRFIANFLWPAWILKHLIMPLLQRLFILMSSRVDSILREDNLRAHSFRAKAPKKRFTNLILIVIVVVTDVTVHPWTDEVSESKTSLAASKKLAIDAKQQVPVTPGETIESYHCNGNHLV